MNISCLFAKRRIVRLLDGELNPSARDALEIHLERCGRCSWARDEVKSVREIMRAIPRVHSSARDRAAILDAVSRDETDREERHFRTPGTGVFTRIDFVTAGALAVGAVLFVLVLTERGKARLPEGWVPSVTAYRTAEWHARQQGAGTEIKQGESQSVESPF